MARKQPFVLSTLYRPLLLAIPIALPLLDRSDYPFDCTRARARAAYATALARALSHLRGRSGNAGGPAPGRGPPRRRTRMAGAQRRPRGAEMQMRDGPGGSNVARSEYNTRRNESD